MPDRRYRPVNRPPSRADRFAAHFAVVVLSVWWVTMGAGVTVTAVLDPPVTSSFAAMADEIGIPLGVAMALGGAGLAWSTLTTTIRVSLVWDVQQSSFLLGFVAWAVYAFMLYRLDAWNWVSVGHGATMATVAGVGFVVSKLAERAGRADIRTAGGTA